MDIGLRDHPDGGTCVYVKVPGSDESLHTEVLAESDCDRAVFLITNFIEEEMLAKLGIRHLKTEPYPLTND